MDHPKTIEKRIFTCTSCSYSAQVHGEQYFDYGCRNFIITFQCLDCKILFENVISELECRNSSNEIIFSIESWEMPEAYRVLVDDVVCMWCGNDKIRVWNKETGNCPKCNGKMDCMIDGVIKVAYKADKRI
ncbi:MAG: hypothetical protein JXB49_26575 [Bacteroidales bacterium]|nr:hypothetical protein [Bacteroidales bacterium]